MSGLLAGLSDEANRSVFLAGVKDMLPVHLGSFPFALIVGVTGVELGFTTVETMVMSAAIFAGSAQLAAMFLIAERANVLIILLTALMINIRFIMYSASLAPIFQQYSRMRKAVYSFLIADPVYALSIPRFQDSEESDAHWYYFGGGLSLWSVWVIGAAIGAGAGFEIPESFPVELVLPLVFIALLFPVLKDRPSIVTALVAAVVATAAAPLDYNLGLLLGVSSGLLVGVTLNR